MPALSRPARRSRFQHTHPERVTNPNWFEIADGKPKIGVSLEVIRALTQWRYPPAPASDSNRVVCYDLRFKLSD